MKTWMSKLIETNKNKLENRTSVSEIEIEIDESEITILEENCYIDTWDSSQVSETWDSDSELLVLKTESLILENPDNIFVISDDELPEIITIEQDHEILIQSSPIIEDLPLQSVFQPKDECDLPPFRPKPKLKLKPKPKVSTELPLVPLSTDTFEQKLAKFKAMPNYPQKSQKWLDQRNNYLTASIIAKACGVLGHQARQELLLDKATYGQAKPFTGNVATAWGNKYEECAADTYAYRKKVKIYNFGMITNIKYPFLGISPDGVTEECLLEIKAPYSRVIDGKVKTEYYHQMQEQMLVTEYDSCDFLECKFAEINSKLFWDEFDNAFEHPEKGIILKYLDLNSTEPNLYVQHLRSPIEFHNNRDKLKQWEQIQMKRLRDTDNLLYLDLTYWRLERYACQRVYRDPQWFETYYPILEEFWTEVEYCRTLSDTDLKIHLGDCTESPSPVAFQKPTFLGCIC